MRIILLALIYALMILLVADVIPPIVKGRVYAENSRWNLCYFESDDYARCMRHEPINGTLGGKR